MAAHSSVLAWRIPGTAGPGGLPSMGSHRVRQRGAQLRAAPPGALRSVDTPTPRGPPPDKDLESLQLCPTLCDPIDGSPPGSPVPGILQARTLEWAAISSSRGLAGGRCAAGDRRPKPRSAARVPPPPLGPSAEAAPRLGAQGATRTAAKVATPGPRSATGKKVRRGPQAGWKVAPGCSPVC